MITFHLGKPLVGGRQRCVTDDGQENITCWFEPVTMSIKFPFLHFPNARHVDLHQSLLFAILVGVSTNHKS